MQVRTESIELLSKPDKTSYYTTDTLDLTGATLKINYEDNYSVTVPLTESMLTYKMEEGTQVVTVEYNGCTTGFEIEVEKLPESLTITDKKTKLEVSSSYEYKVKYVGTGTVTFASSNPQILRVDKTTGKATAKKAGTATITIKAGNLTESIEVKVVKKKVKESLTIIAKKTKLKVGSSYKYKVKYVGDGAVTYSSSDSKKLKINKTTGKATAKKAGTATITIKAGSLSKKIKVKVVK